MYKNTYIYISTNINKQIYIYTYICIRPTLGTPNKREVEEHLRCLQRPSAVVAYRDFVPYLLIQHVCTTRGVCDVLAIALLHSLGSDQLTTHR